MSNIPLIARASSDSQYSPLGSGESRGFGLSASFATEASSMPVTDVVKPSRAYTGGGFHRVPATHGASLCGPHSTFGS